MAAGCGVPAQSRPESLEVQAVGPIRHDGEGLRSRLDISRRDVYFVRGHRLVRESRRVSAYSGVDGSLDALNRGPTTTEAARGIRTALPGGAGPLTALIGDGVARVTLPDSYGAVPAASQVLAIAQIVYTVTSIDGIVRVEFEIGGQPIEVPVYRGQLHEHPVSRADYASVAPVAVLEPGAIGPHAGGHPRP